VNLATPNQFAAGFSLFGKAWRGWGHYIGAGRAFQWKSADEIAACQFARLRHVVRLAADRVPFYQRRFRDIGFEPGDLRSLDDLRRLPVLTKRDLRDNFHDLFDRTRTREAVLSRTSGTTGEPTQFLLSRDQTVFELAYLWRFWSWAGYRPWARVAAFRHYLPQPGEPISRYDWRSNTLFFSVYDMYESRLAEYVDAFRKFRPEIVRGYPSSIQIFSQFARASGQALPKPRAIITSSETLLPQQRAEIETTLGAPVFDWYGTNERVLTACQCEQRAEYHQNAEAGIAEFGPPVSGDDARPLILTGLVNTIMPLIRFDPGDLAIPGAKPCPCGRGLPTIKAFVGRTDDILLTHEGKHIPPVRFYTLFEDYPQISQFQVVQSSRDAVTVRLCPQLPAEPVLGEIRAKLTRYLGDGVQIQFEPAAHLARTANGKTRHVCSQVRA